MSQIITFQKALTVSQLLIGFLIAFHILIVSLTLFEIDFFMKYTWGGEIKSSDEFIKLEMVSILASSFCFSLILLRNRAKSKIWLIISRIGLSLFFFMFLLNTLGNILAASIFEKSLALVTILIAVLLLRIILEPIRKRS
ncbi:hypothetical protein MATR_19250 [Marivirga tractuosa]|uniref:Uncharacterized protein n=1 Tax=Marivirga tractuosa (strain ATCC 23168 / DSM 4126 / NBRC 15989 / NCIMB 1408 / VKM B-1430 / H-43) TaxID=643867 RepID=E4TNJ8_MARTH|nr:hypothetical protein Ftrac_0449 [Marivirga tractuosa DSM 4126]BDD15100.1 hypothetical protein MATR_19250 [Marivirga tractuosa]